ncbi:MAG: alpha/beta hydrolase [Acidobacteriota bacterium]|nr:alpha/beta hydrolase [Acidobacteriota bacterium]
MRTSEHQSGKPSAALIAKPRGNQQRLRRMVFALIGWTFVLGSYGLVSAAAGPSSAIQSREFYVSTTDSVSIHVVEKYRNGERKIPILLVHGTWGSSQTWDFPDRSVMDYLATRGYDVYALDFRGMGKSDRPANYFAIGLLDRVRDLAAVASYIVATTGHRPVVAGFSQGGLLTGLLAASNPELVEGVGLFSVPGDGFNTPASFEPIIASVVASGVDRYLPPAEMIYAIAFGADPVTGRPTISNEAFTRFVAMSEPDGVRVVLEQVSPEYFHAVVASAWPRIHAPALVVDGAQDLLVGETRARALYDALGSQRKALLILPRNAHAWFLEDNFQATLRTFDAFLAHFPKSDTDCQNNKPGCTSDR